MRGNWNIKFTVHFIRRIICRNCNNLHIILSWGLSSSFSILQVVVQKLGQITSSRLRNLSQGRWSQKGTCRILRVPGWWLSTAAKLKTEVTLLNSFLKLIMTLFSGFVENFVQRTGTQQVVIERRRYVAGGSRSLEPSYIERDISSS